MKLRKALSLFSAVLILTATFPLGSLTASADYDYGEFSSCWCYTYDIVNNEAIIGNIAQDPFHHDSGYIINIPDKIDGYPVTGIRGLITVDFDYMLLLPDTIKYFDLDLGLGILCSDPWYNYYSCLKYWGSENNEYLVLVGPESKDIIDIDFHEDVKVIAGYAFKDCTSLTDITIPDGVTNIGSHAFDGCTNLTSITIPDGVTSIGNYAFYGCSSLTSITIPDSVTSIGSYAFGGCTSLTSVTIPDGVTSMGNDAFHGCTSLESITIPNSVTSIGYAAFYGCDNLQYNTYGNGKYLGNDENNYLALIDTNSTNITNFTYADGVKVIADSAFYGCTSLTDITIPDGVASIGSYTFGDCTSLRSITIPSSVTSIDYYAFSYCTSLVSITKPDNVVNVNSNAFYKCKIKKLIIADGSKSLAPENIICKSTLEEIIIPDSVTSIGSRTFEDCTSLTSVTIPDSVTSIGRYAFEYCKSLTNITLPNGVTTIAYSAFYGCTNLTSITIPDSVTSISHSAFYGCDNLQYNTYGNGKYLGNDENNYLALIDTNSTSITNFTCADGVKVIADSAFDGCTNLKTVYYLGTQEEWNNISIGSHNYPLTGATLVLHTYGDDDRVWKTAIEPTFTEEGLKQYICTVCGAVFESKTISKLIYGDADRDGKINSSDLVVLRKGLIGGMTDYSKNMSFDINGDEAINLLDLVRLKKYLADPENVILGTDNAGTETDGDSETAPDGSGSGTGGNTTDPDENESGEDIDTDTDLGGDVTDPGDDFTDSGNGSTDSSGFEPGTPGDDSFIFEDDFF